MMGPRRVEQGALFYNFSLDRHVPADHMLRAINRFIDLSFPKTCPFRKSHPSWIRVLWQNHRIMKRDA